MWSAKHLEENLCEFGASKHFQKHKKDLAIKDKLNKLDFLKIKHFALQKKALLKN